jgi:hypothetical protein
MLIFLSLALFALAVCLLFLLPFLVGTQLYNQYSGARAVTCPENHGQVAVSLDALRAAGSGLAGKPSLRIAGCTRWPERANCGQECMPQAIAVDTHTDGEVTPSMGPIFHLPVVLAAFVAWVIGAFWHSQYFFRTEWRDAVGLSRWDLHQLGWQLTPHLLTFAAPLLFAYAVSMVLARIGRYGPILGASVSIFMWAAFVVVLFVFAGLASLPRELLMLELGYTLIAAVVIGFTIGQFNGKIFRRRGAALSH